MPSLPRLFRTPDLKLMIFSVNVECLLLVENSLECSHAGSFLTNELLKGEIKFML